MATFVSRYMKTHIAILCALCALFSVPMVDIHAQSPEQLVTVSEVVAVATPHPYKIDKLLGDEVYGDFVVGPGKLEVSIKPGQTKIVEITVSNRTGGDREFILATEDIAGSQDPAQAVVLLGDDRGPYSMKDYISIEAPQFVLGHNERAYIPVTISVPSDAVPGGLYGSVLVSTVSVKAQTGEEEGTLPQSAVVARVGSLFFITIPGTVEKNGILKDFGTSPKKTMYQNGPINFGVLFENTGSSHLFPSGELRVKNMFGEEVGYVELDPWFVLPQALRLREASWNRDFLFGRYTATALINRGYDDVIDEMSYTFWVLPWKPIAGVFTGLFIAFFLIRTFFKTFEFRRKE